MSETNADQSEFWNGEPGQGWVEHRAVLDANHAGVADHLMQIAAPKAGERVIDIGCGAGRTTFMLASAVGDEGRATGIDISKPLLEIAEAHRVSEGVRNADFLLADAQTHPFAPGSTDLIASRFGVMFFEDSVAAFANMRRALKPGGRIAFAAWDGPERQPIFDVPQRVAIGHMGPLPPSPPDAPGPMAFRDTDKVLGLLVGAGYSNAAVQTHDIDLHHSGGLEVIIELLRHIGSIGGVLRAHGGTEADKNRILADVKAEFASYVTDDGIRIPASIHFYTATAP